MEIDRLHKLQDDRSDCRSIGSNYQPSSQSRKISVGITIDSLGTKRSGATKKEEIIISNAERENDNKENSLEDKMKGKGVAEAIEGKHTEAPEKVTSPWITTRSFYQNPPTSETFVFGKQTSNLPATKGRRSKLSRPQDTAIAHSVELLENQFGDGKQKTFKGLIYKRKGSNDGNSQKAADFTFATAQEVLVSDKVATESESKRENRRTETLRMKLWEILGTVSSPRSQPSNSQARDEGANNSKLEKSHHQNGDAVIKPIQNSDTIETDSENPDHTMKRPATRSLTQNIVKSKAQPVKTKTGPSSSYRNKLPEKNIFSFEEGLLGKGDGAVNGGSSMSGRKKGGRKTYGIEPHKIHFSEKNNADGIQGEHCTSVNPTPVEKASSYSDRRENIQGCSPQSKGEYVEQINRTQGDTHQSPRTDSHYSAGKNRVERQGDDSSRAVPENKDQQEAFDQPYLKNFMDPQDEFQSPTFRISTPMLSSSPSSTPNSDQTPNTDQLEQKLYSPLLAGTRFNLGKIRNFRTMNNSKADCHTPNSKTESSDDEMELKDSPPSKPSPLKGRKEVEDGLSKSSSEYEDSMRSEEEHTEIDAFTPERSNSVLYSSKRLRNLEGKSVSNFNSTLPSTTGIGDSDWNPEPSEQKQENEIERVITLFALALENFKNKMKAAIRKRSSDILISVSEDIHLQLQNVVSQIQTDVGELTSNCKSKRKVLEMKFQEQQEKLNLIQDKFKQDIHQHLQDCKSSVEELEMHNFDLKGTVKKQKASHKKLLMKVEEAVETQLNGAERRITAVNKASFLLLFMGKESRASFPYIWALYALFCL
eukprot:XP_015572309.1 meiosis-specific protein ASY3 isoform X1 [Ricinus communis]